MSTTGGEDFLAGAARLCGEERVLVGDAIPRAHTDSWEGKASGKPLAVVSPGDTAQVAEMVVLCRAHGIRMVVQGGHTGMCGGATPDDDLREIVLSMHRLNRIRRVDVENNTLTVEAGCLLESVCHAAEAAGRYFPLDLGSKGSCQIGGNLATNAGGLNVLRYGSARELCLGMEAVLADGSVLRQLSGVRKDNSGYDLKHWLIGSEGTLGIITAATLKVFPPSRPVLTAWIAPASVVAALEVLDFLNEKTGGQVSAFEGVPRESMEMVARYAPECRQPFVPALPWAVLLEVRAREAVRDIALAALEDCLRRGAVTDVIVASSEGERQSFWRLRETAPVAKASHGDWIRSDVAVPLSSLAAYIDELRGALPEICDGRYVIGFGHWGDGNLHVSARPYDQDPGRHPERTAALTEAIHEGAVRLGGSFAAEHGIGRFKVSALRQYKDPAALAMMRKIKASLDPDNLLNPGRVVG